MLTGKVFRCASVMWVLDWCVIRPLIYAFRCGRQTRKDAVAQRNGAEYSSTWRRSSGSGGACSLSSSSSSRCRRSGCEVVFGFDFDLEVCDLEEGGVALNCTSSYASTIPFAGGK